MDSTIRSTPTATLLAFKSPDVFNHVFAETETLSVKYEEQGAATTHVAFKSDRTLCGFRFCPRVV